MSIDRVMEILATHADELNRGRAIGTAEYLHDKAEYAAELAPLLDMAVRVKQTLTLVKPAPAFRARLQDGLLMAAHHQATHRILIEKKTEPQWGWLIGAAAIGSAAGLIALALRSRPAETHAPVQAGCENVMGGPSA